MRRYLNRGSALDRARARLSSGSAVLFAALMAANGLAYLYLMLVARLLTPAEYGILVTLTSASFVLSVLMRTIQAWVVKATALLPGLGTGDVRRIFTLTSRILVPAGIVILGLHWLASGWAANFLHIGSGAPIIILGLYSSSSLLVPVPRGVLLGIKRLRLAGVVNVAEVAVRLVCGLFLVILGLGVRGALVAYTVGNVVSFLLAMVVLWPLVRPSREPPSRAEITRGLDGYATLLLIGNTCLMVVASLDQVAVKHFFSDQVAGNYAVAFLLGRVIALTTVSLGWVIFARSATLPENDPRRARIFFTGLLSIGGFASALTAGYLVLPGLAIRLMGGSQYVFAENYVGLVGIEMTLFALIYIQSYYLMSMKRMLVVWPLGLAVVCELVLVAGFHDTVQHMLLCLIAVLAGLLIIVSAMSGLALRDLNRITSASVPGTARRAVKTA
ncbi:MAG TPA: oligosaccharide flippase family protein [Chloroflexota bacterium]|nr:oligosaccharide flippase family protein [Chloroflexota bacterium]